MSPLADAAWTALLAGDEATAYQTALSIGFPAALDALRVRAIVLARFGTDREALPAIGQLGAFATREGRPDYALCAELLAAVRVRPDQRADHIDRILRTSRGLDEATLATVIDDLRPVFSTALDEVRRSIARLEPANALA